MEGEARRLTRLNARLYQGVVGRLHGVALNGDHERRIPGNLNFAFAGVDGEDLIKAMPNLAVSSGSACTSASVEPSYVISALGRPEELARSSVRVGLGRFTTDEDVEIALDTIVAAVERLRGLGGSPPAAADEDARISTAVPEKH
jgi:cysteine desulfurase